MPLALAYMRTLELMGARVLNGADVFALELSKSAQATLLHTLGIDTPALHHVQRRRRAATHAAQITLAGAAEARPGRQRRADPGGRVARRRSRRSSARDPSIWLPDNLFLLQEYLPHDPEQGIVRLEFLGGELLYAMRVKTHGRFNLCPSPVCNPGRRRRRLRGAGRHRSTAPPVEFYPYPDVPREAVETAQRIVQAARLDVGGIEYLETPDGRRVFYDINANSNLRPSVAAAFGFDPFERVVDFLERHVRDSSAGLQACREAGLKGPPYVRG